MSDELTPRQIEFLRFYNDPNSETFGNAKQSALKAGYSEEYSSNLTGQFPEWLSENISRRKRLLEKAEKNLEEALDMDSAVIANKEGTLIEANNIDIVKVKVDVSKHITKTLGSKHGYSEKTEVEHSGSISLSDLFNKSKENE